MTQTKYINFRGLTYTITKCTDGLWRDADGTIYGLTDDENSVDIVIRCGVGWASLLEDSKYTDACKAHDYAYTSPAYQLFHTREEADEMLRKHTSLLGSNLLGRVFHLVSRLLGKKYWENKKTE